MVYMFVFDELNSLKVWFWHQNAINSTCQHAKLMMRSRWRFCTNVRPNRWSRTDYTGLKWFFGRILNFVVCVVCYSLLDCSKLTMTYGTVLEFGLLFCFFSPFHLRVFSKIHFLKTKTSKSNFFNVFLSNSTSPPWSFNHLKLLNSFRQKNCEI